MCTFGQRRSRSTGDDERSYGLVASDAKGHRSAGTDCTFTTIAAVSRATGEFAARSQLALRY